MQHSEQAASVVRLCYFPAGLRCEGVETLTCRAENTDPRCDSHEEYVKAPWTFSVSVCVFKNITQTACTASKSCPPAPLLHALLPLQWIIFRHATGICCHQRGSVAGSVLQAAPESLNRVWVWPSASFWRLAWVTAAAAACVPADLAYFSPAPIPSFFLTLLPSLLSVWVLQSGGKFELWRLQQGEGLVSGRREGKKERRKA